MSYFVITTSEDGLYIEQMDKETLLKKLDDGDWDDSYEVRTRIPDSRDPNYWGSSVTIIKGEVVTSKPVAVATRFEVK